MTIDSKTYRHTNPRNRVTDWKFEGTHPRRHNRLLTGKETGPNATGRRGRVWVRDMGDIDEETGQPVAPPHIIFCDTSEHVRSAPPLTDDKGNNRWMRVPLKPGQDEHHAIAKIEKFYGMPHRFHPCAELDEDDVI